MAWLGCRLKDGPAQCTDKCMLIGYSTWNRKTNFFPRHYLRNRSNLDVGMFGYINVNQHKECSHEVWQTLPGTLCVSYQAVEGSETFFNILLGYLDS